MLGHINRKEDRARSFAVSAAGLGLIRTAVTSRHWRSTGWTPEPDLAAVLYPEERKSAVFRNWLKVTTRHFHKLLHPEKTRVSHSSYDGGTKNCVARASSGQLMFEKEIHEGKV